MARLKLKEIHTRDIPTRGFVERTYASMRKTFVRRGYKLVECDGEAHSNGHIDHCGLCMNAEWGWKAVKETK